MVLENHKKLNFYKSLEIGKEKEEFVKNIFKDYLIAFQLYYFT